MNDIISKLKTPEECETLEKNASDRGHSDLALSARKRAIEFRALQKGAKNQAERGCLTAIYAYEHALSKSRGKKTRATRTWQMINRHGIIGAVERAVNRKSDASGYWTLLELGLRDYSFEAVVLWLPQMFSPEAIKRSQQRVEEDSGVCAQPQFSRPTL